jgi:hypothetical protein
MPRHSTSRLYERAGGTVPSVTRLTPTCVWRATPELVIALDERFGEPTDSYVNGSQTWLRADGPDGERFEWRLHPVAAYVRPESVDVPDVFAAVAFALANGHEPPAPLDSLWGGLEVFPADDAEIEPASLASLAVAQLGIPPDGSGLVDHDRIADQWERSRGDLSIVDALLAQLDVPNPKP